MKALILFLTISVSLILTSCSQTDQDNSPLAPQMNKSIESLNNPFLPYSYLATFPEINNVKWEESISDDNWVLVLLDKQDREFHHIYCEVVYDDDKEPVKKTSELFFVGKPVNNRFAFTKPFNKQIADVKVYAVYDYPSSSEYVQNSEGTQFPFTPNQKFNMIYVKSWDTKESIITVNAANDVDNSKLVFVKIDSKVGNMLVFGGKPVSEFFDIPKYGDSGVEDIALYGLSYVRTHDVE